LKRIYAIGQLQTGHRRGVLGNAVRRRIDTKLAGLRRQVFSCQFALRKDLLQAARRKQRPVDTRPIQDAQDKQPHQPGFGRDPAAQIQADPENAGQDKPGAPGKIEWRVTADRPDAGSQRQAEAGQGGEGQAGAARAQPGG
jgi:hypothetical protein